MRKRGSEVGNSLIRSPFTFHRASRLSPWDRGTSEAEGVDS